MERFQALIEALLKYQKALGIDLNPQPIGYNVLANLSGYPSGRSIGDYLECVKRWCIGNKYPPLNALAAHSMDNPGDGYESVDPTKTWKDEFDEVIRFVRYPKEVTVNRLDSEHAKICGSNNTEVNISVKTRHIVGRVNYADPKIINKVK